MRSVHETSKIIKKTQDLRILNTGHQFGKTDKIMTIFKTALKGLYMKSLENYYIQKITNQNLQLNNTQVNIQNPVLNVLLKYLKQHPFFSPPPPPVRCAPGCG
jgi:hypothetical protein